MFDSIIIGGGIAGCTVAHALCEQGFKTALVDKADICSGASGAAGAFVSPVPGGAGALRTLRDEAFCYATEFYREFFPSCIESEGTYLLPKREKNIDEFLRLHIPNKSKCTYFQPDELPFLTPHAGRFGAYYMPDALRVNVQKLCAALTQKAESFSGVEVVSIEKKGEIWVLNDGEFEAKTVVVACGFDTVKLLNEPYLHTYLVGLWGQKIEISSTTAPPAFIGGELLISTIKDGMVAVGATHIRAQHPLDISEDDSMRLLSEAKLITPLEEAAIVSVKTGMRSVCIDHFPVTGEVVDSSCTKKALPGLAHGQIVPPSAYTYRKGLFVHAGHGSRAFLHSPYTAKLLAAHIVKGEPIPHYIEPSRLFERVAKRTPLPL